MTPNNELLGLRDSFLKRGFDIRFVGGCVRDHLIGRTPHDFDFATDATPDEQRKIYEEDDIHHIDTGLQHGTWTVVLSDTYEITSLRSETDHDGRRAKVTWIKDWIADLARRDFTINAMSYTFDGEFIDPFNGYDDLNNKKLRFVGDPVHRMKEDYLRILRFFRFNGRFGSPDIKDVSKLIRHCGPGLKHISKERVWSEFSKIIGETPWVIKDILDLGIHEFIELPCIDANIFEFLLKIQTLTKQPSTLMAVYLGDSTVVKNLAINWKWSGKDRDEAIFITRHMKEDWTEVDCKKMLVSGTSLHYVIETLKVMLKPDLIELIKNWKVPKFPIDGNDLLTLGYHGVKLGDVQKSLKNLWINSNYSMTKSQLLKNVP